MLRKLFLILALSLSMVLTAANNVVALDSERVQREARAAEELGRQAKDAFDVADAKKRIKEAKERALNEARRAVANLPPECNSEHCQEVRQAMNEAQDAFNEALGEFNRAKRRAEDLERQAKRAADAVKEELGDVKRRAQEMAGLKDLSDVDGGAIAKAMVLINTLNDMGRAGDAQKLSIMLAEAIIVTGPAAAAEIAQAMGDIFNEVEEGARKQAKQIENEVRRAERHGRESANQARATAQQANEQLLGVISQMR